MLLLIKENGAFKPVEKIHEKALEEQWGKLEKMVIPLKGKADKTIWLRQPVRGEVKAALLHETTADGKTDRITPGEMILETCMVAGDQEVLKEDSYFFRAALMSYYWLQKRLGFI